MAQLVNYATITITFGRCTETLRFPVIQFRLLVALLRRLCKDLHVKDSDDKCILSYISNIETLDRFVDKFEFLYGDQI